MLLLIPILWLIVSTTLNIAAITLVLDRVTTLSETIQASFRASKTIDAAPVIHLLQSAFYSINGNYELGSETPGVCTSGEWFGPTLQLVCLVVAIGALAAVSTIRCGVKEVYKGPWDAPEPFVVNISGDYDSLTTKNNLPPSPSFSSRSSALGADDDESIHALLASPWSTTSNASDVSLADRDEALVVVPTTWLGTQNASSDIDSVVALGDLFDIARLSEFDAKWATGVAEAYGQDLRHDTQAAGGNGTPLTHDDVTVATDLYHHHLGRRYLVKQRVRDWVGLVYPYVRPPTMIDSTQYHEKVDHEPAGNWRRG